MALIKERSGTPGLTIRRRASPQGVDSKDVSREIATRAAARTRLSADVSNGCCSAKTLRNIRGAWIKEQHVRCTDGRVMEYQVNMMVTFILDD